MALHTFAFVLCPFQMAHAKRYNYIDYIFESIFMDFVCFVCIFLFNVLLAIAFIIKFFQLNCKVETSSDRAVQVGNNLILQNYRGAKVN